MAVQGIDALIVTTHDILQARQFLMDWGLDDISPTAETCVFSTVNGATVTAMLCEEGDEPGLIEVVWGAQDSEALNESIALAEAGGKVQHDPDGSIVFADPDGVRHRLRSRLTTEVASAPTPVNAPGKAGRIDTRSPIHNYATPLTIGHIVLFVNAYLPSLAFYRDRLGFVLSDSYPGQAAFLRAQVRGVHHNAFILERSSKPGLNHIAFTVNDIHEVLGGGLAMSRKGWPTELGPGRHPISSAYFWYFKSPFGGAFEYYADDDFCTEAWVPGEFPRTPEMFAEWAIAGGLDGTTRRQSRGPGTGNLNPVSNSEPKGLSK